MAKAVTDENRILKELPKIISWMKDLGLPANISRYARYEERINKFYRDGNDPLSEEGERNWIELTRAYRECIDIYFVYKSFADVRHPNFISAMSKVVSGEDVPDLEAAGASRNYLFELLIAARFHLAGYTIDFDETNDVVARRDGFVVRAECKRLVSERQLEKRIKRAAEQLDAAMTRANEHALGMVFVDVSTCVAPDLPQVVSTQDDADRHTKAAVGNFLWRNGHLIERLNHKHLDISYATCLVGISSIWSRDLVLHTCVASAVRAATALSDEKYSHLERALADFDKALSSIF